MASSSSSASSTNTKEEKPQRRLSKRPRRGCVYELARLLVEGKKTVIITGAGLSVASGVRPFRGAGGVWSSVVYDQSTRHSFRKNPLDWYNKFWIPHFVASDEDVFPNEGHAALERLMDMCPSISLITQNIDGLHDNSSNNQNIIEAHGRLGLYKCIPDSDSDTDSDDDEDDDRLVHLGHRRKSRALRRAYYKKKNGQSMNGSSCTKENGSACYKKKNEKCMHGSSGTKENGNGESNMNADDDSFHESTSTRVPCRYELVDSIPLTEVQPPSVHAALLGAGPLRTPPRCPACHKPCPPQALLFDEGYHSYDHYQFEHMEDLMGGCEVLVFVGTSFSGVRLTSVALEHARSVGLRVYNFNAKDTLQHSDNLNVQNVVGPAQETLPRLLEACRELQRKRASMDANQVGTPRRRRGKRDRDPEMYRT